MSSQRLTQTQKMLQKLSPQQILLMKLLQIPTMELSSRIKEEIEENPALEESESFDDIDNDSDTNSDSDSDTDFDSDADDYDPLSDFDDYMQDDDDDDAAYKLKANNHSRDDEHYEAPLSDEESFQDILRKPYIGTHKKFLVVTILSTGFLQIHGCLGILLKKLFHTATVVTVCMG